MFVDRSKKVPDVTIPTFQNIIQNWNSHSDVFRKNKPASLSERMEAHDLLLGSAQVPILDHHRERSYFSHQKLGWLMTLFYTHMTHMT